MNFSSAKSYNDRFYKDELKILIDYFLWVVLLVQFGIISWQGESLQFLILILFFFGFIVGVKFYCKLNTAIFDLFLLSIIIRFFYLMKVSYVSYRFNLNFLQFFDEYHYHSMGKLIFEDWYNIIKINSPDYRSFYLGGIVKGYEVFLGFLYTMFGPNPIVGKVINILFGSLSGIFGYKIWRNLSITADKFTTILVVSIFFFHPLIIYWSIYQLKDILVFFLMTLFLYGLVCEQRTATIAAVVILIPLRPPMILPCILLSGYFLRRRRKNGVHNRKLKTKNFPQYFLLAGIAFFLIWLFRIDLGDNFLLLVGLDALDLHSLFLFAHSMISLFRDQRDWIYYWVGDPSKYGMSYLLLHLDTFFGISYFYGGLRSFMNRNASHFRALFLVSLMLSVIIMIIDPTYRYRLSVLPMMVPVIVYGVAGMYNNVITRIACRNIRQRP